MASIVDGNADLSWKRFHYHYQGITAVIWPQEYYRRKPWKFWKDAYYVEYDTKIGVLFQQHIIQLRAEPKFADNVNASCAMDWISVP